MLGVYVSCNRCGGGGVARSFHCLVCEPKNTHTKFLFKFNIAILFTVHE